MTPPQTDRPTVADIMATHLRAYGIERIYGLCGGHIQPLWDAIVRAGIEIVDVRHEAAAVYMAHAHSQLTRRVAVALVTAGPGLTNAVTAVSNADVSRVPVVVLSARTPRPQEGMRAMQDVPQRDIMQAITRRADAVGHQRHVPDRLLLSLRAALGAEGPPGPTYLDVPTDVLVETWEGPLPQTPEGPVSLPRMTPDREQVERAADAVSTGRRIVVMTGRGVQDYPDALADLLEVTGGVHLDSAESRGALPEDHPAQVTGARGKVMTSADLVITVGRRLDFQLGYGSPAAFTADPQFVRIGDSEDELAENRSGSAELRGDIGRCLEELSCALRSRALSPDADWHTEITGTHRQRVERLAAKLEAAGSDDEGIDPYALIREVNRIVADDTVTIADGGDILSFARVALKAPRYLDCGALGCLGVGIPFAVSAALNTQASGPVVALIGDGSFGFTAMEIDTAVRQSANAVFVVANNEAWNIERQDQIDRFESRLVGVDLPGCRYDLLAQALGAYGEHVSKLADLPAALERAVASTPAVIDVRVSRNPRSPDLMSGLAEVPPFQALVRWNEVEEHVRSATRPR